MAMTWQEHAKLLGIDPARLEPPPRPPTPSTRPAGPAEPAKSSRPSKYRNRRTPYNGRTYSSRAEAKRAMQLDTLAAAGLVLWWMPQPVIHLGPAAVRYSPDFVVVARDGWRFEDVKGMETERFRVIVQLWRVHGPAPLHVRYRDRTEIIAGISDGSFE